MAGVHLDLELLGGEPRRGARRGRRRSRCAGGSAGGRGRRARRRPRAARGHAPAARRWRRRAAGSGPGVASVVPVRASRASSDSAIRAAARIIARLCGEATSGPPVMSTTPSTRLVVGSVIGRGGTAPRVHQPVEVLGRVHVHRPPEVQGHAGRVGAGVVLAPHRALDEVDRLGLAHDPGRPGHPEQLPVGVTDGHDAVAVDGRPAEHVVEQGEDVREGVRGAVVGEVAGLEQHRREVRLGVDPGRRRAQPRLRDQRAHPGGRRGRHGPGPARPGRTPRRAAVSSPASVNPVRPAG